MPVTMSRKELDTTMTGLDLRQLDLAHMFDRTPRQIRRWQKGDATVPTAEAIVLRLMHRGLVEQTAVHEAKKARRA